MTEYSNEIVEVVLPAKDIPIGSEVKRIGDNSYRKLFLTDSLKIYGKANGFTGVEQEIKYTGKKMLMHWQGVNLIDDDFNLIWVTSRQHYNSHMKFLQAHKTQKVY